MMRMVLGAALLLMACKGDGDDSGVNEGDGAGLPYGASTSFDVTQAGPYNVGFTSWEHTWEDPALPAPRTITMNLWYPTQDTEGDPAKYFGFIPDDQAFLDATPAPPAESGGYPVHLRSHGWSGYAADGPFLHRTLASHGWVTIAPDHTGNTLAKHEDALPPWMYWARAQDLDEALDQLAAQAPSLLAGAPDVDHSLMTGHSFGGFFAWAVGGGAFDMEGWQARCDGGSFSEDCRDEDLAKFQAGFAMDRVATVGVLAGAGSQDLFGDTGRHAVDVPVIMFEGTEDDRNAGETYDGAKGGVDLVWINILGACHTAFTLGGCSGIDDQAGWNILEEYILAQGRAHVLGDTDPTVQGILDGSVDVDAALVEYIAD